jgi:hypothetical protein
MIMVADAGEVWVRKYGAKANGTPLNTTSPCGTEQIPDLKDQLDLKIASRHAQ